jgi:hypothetical protein
MGIADGCLGPGVAHICGLLIESYSFFFILQDPVPLAIEIR